MPSNRGAHPEDPEQFGPSQWDRLRAAVRDLSWLRTRGYEGSAARRLVGNRYRLKRRQRNAVARSACSDQSRAHRLRARLSASEVDGQKIEIDTFNVLITLEAALGGAYLFVGRDTAFRDVDPLQGSYRIVRQTSPALKYLTGTLQALNPEGVVWHLDQSISNVGRVKTRLEATLSEAEISGRIAVESHVDALLRESKNPVVTSDSAILDRTRSWLHLEALVQDRHVPDANLVDLRPDGERAPLHETAWPG